MAFTIYNLTSNTAFTDATTIPPGCPALIQHASTTVYLLTRGPNVPSGFAACVVLPSGAAIGDILELLGDYSNTFSVTTYPAPGETVANQPGGGNISLSSGSTRILQKITATDWRTLSPAAN